MAFGGKQFHCKMSCDHELANEWARCSEEKKQEYNNTTDACDASTNNYIVFLHVAIVKLFYRHVSIIYTLVGAILSSAFVLQ